MLSKETQSQLRSRLFYHLDGLVTAPTAYTLYEKGVLDYLSKEKEAEITAISSHFKANEGYMNVALRVLCSQGWLDQSIDNKNDHVIFRVNENSEKAFSVIPQYENAVKLIRYSGDFHPRKFEKEPFLMLEKNFALYKKYSEEPLADDEVLSRIKEQVLHHIEGILTGPTVVLLGMSGMFHKYFMEASFRAEEFHADGKSFSVMLDFFNYLGWFSKKNETYQFTEKGLFFAKRASAYGVTVSYLPMFRHLDALIFGDPKVLKAGPGEPERHVDREMNVWGSGGAHAAYFKKVDEVLIDLFNRPIEDQPRGVLDMGCGNGAFLEHIFEVIEQRTIRGKILDEHPLILVGADFNQAALKVTRANLIQADIWAKVVWGDISRPDLLAENLKDDYGIDLHDLLNVRTFLDHNRIWSEPETTSKRVSKSTGAFAYSGRRLPNNLVEENLLMHLNSWKPYLKKFGLLVIELHTLDSALTAKNLGKTPATAYDATHGFSDQFIVEAEVFQAVAREAGLVPAEAHHSRFPDSELATVTINLLIPE